MSLVYLLHIIRISNKITFVCLYYYTVSFEWNFAHNFALGKQYHVVQTFGLAFFEGMKIAQ